LCQEREYFTSHHEVPVWLDEKFDKQGIAEERAFSQPSPLNKHKKERPPPKGDATLNASI